MQTALTAPMRAMTALRAQTYPMLSRGTMTFLTQAAIPNRRRTARRAAPTVHRKAAPTARTSRARIPQQHRQRPLQSSRRPQLHQGRPPLLQRRPPKPPQQRPSQLPPPREHLCKGTVRCISAAIISLTAKDRCSCSRVCPLTASCGRIFQTSSRLIRSKSCVMTGSATQ